MIHDEVWKVHAACRDSPPGWWYPESSASPVRAVRVCAGCPVRVDCLRFALVGVEVFGTWGGASERVRRHLRAVWAGCPHPDRLAGPEGCACKFCRALQVHESRLQALAAGEPVERLVTTSGASHGTPSCYPKGCRRPECLAALKEWRRARRELLAAELVVEGDDHGRDEVA